MKSHSAGPGLSRGLQAHSHGVNRATSNVLIENFVDSLLAFDSIQTSENITDCRYKKFAATAFYCHRTFR